MQIAVVLPTFNAVRHFLNSRRRGAKTERISVDNVKFRIITSLTLCFMAVTHPATAQTSAVQAEAIVAKGVPQAEAEISRIATQAANARNFFEEDYGWIKVEARYDVHEGVLFLDPGIRLGPISGYPEVEDLHAEVNVSVRPRAELLPNYVRIEWVYGGHDLYYWFPQDRRSSDDRLNGKSSGNSGGGSGVLVSAGHGYYFHHRYVDWRPQRSALRV
jgi:hypothetical protein